MARRKSNNVTFSLFSFQDIITSVTGIMLLITLILALEFLNRVNAAPTARTAQRLEDSRQTVQEIEKEIAAIQARLKARSQAASALPAQDVAALTQRADDLEADCKRLEEETSAANAEHQRQARQLEESKAQSSQDDEKIEKERQRIEKEIAESEKRLREIEQGNRIYYKSGIEGKKIWLVEITADAYRVAPIGVAQPPQSFTSITSFTRWAHGLSTSSDAFLLVLKPGGKSRYRRCYELLIEGKSGKSFDLGVRVIAADQQVLDSQTGAGGP